MKCNTGYKSNAGKEKFKICYEKNTLKQSNGCEASDKGKQRLAEKISPAQIAKELGVHRSTIVREIQRNTAPDFNGLYCYQVAQNTAATRRSNASAHKKFAQHKEVAGYIHERLAVHASPNVITAGVALASIKLWQPFVHKAGSH
ncbi:helix-turn-helix domain-containing protein [Acerihabitans arboris]|uniref:Helix-turn-helix domain-containing protein n=1 Tax=Acerihabitans arboris TaxID=2691583 RepID=A0A845SKZ6_9GAMM|nr:helix-turn-helix domain-containing protein [Acerihabitans arboris]NDL65600.1 helix-turn-helix domain-containing protein [Acerihabitans arboris]